MEDGGTHIGIVRLCRHLTTWVSSVQFPNGVGAYTHSAEELQPGTRLKVRFRDFAVVGQTVPRAAEWSDEEEAIFTQIEADIRREKGLPA